MDGIMVHVGRISQPSAGWNQWILSTGSKIILRYLPWETIEAVRGTYNWDAVWDAEVNYWRNQGWRVILGVKTSPQWARVYPNYINSRIRSKYWQDCADFAVAALNRYGLNGFVIWNEPDVYPLDSLPEHFGGWGDPSLPSYGGKNYGSFINFFINAVRAVRPTTTVHLSALMNQEHPAGGKPENTFFDGMVSRLAKPYKADYLHVHSYTWWGMGLEIDPDVNLSGPEHWYGEGSIWGKIRYYRDVLNQYGGGSPLPKFWISECALVINGVGVDCHPPQFQEDKANYFWRASMRAIKELAGQPDTKFLWYEVVESEWQCVAVYGELAQQTYEFIDSLTGWQFYSFDDYGGSVFEDYLFRKWESGQWKYLAVMWSNDGSQTREHPRDGATWYDYLGNSISASGATETIGYWPKIAIA